MRKSFLVVFVFVFFTSINSQNKYSFTFENSTVSDISELYMAVSGTPWGYNLVDRVLPSGASIEIIYESAESECNFDFFAVGSNGSSYSFIEYDLCQSDYFQLVDLYNTADNHGDYQGDDNNYEIDGDIKDVITYSTWRILVDEFEYGTLKLNPDGSVIKTGSEGYMETRGTWSLDNSGFYLTLHFPDEGQAFTGELNYRGPEMDLSFEGGAIIWLLKSN